MRIQSWLISLLVIWLTGCTKSEVRSAGSFEKDFDSLRTLTIHPKLLARAEQVATSADLRILVALNRPPERQQWLLLLRPGGEVAARKPEPDMEFHTSLGQRIIFTHHWEPVTIHIVGPIDLISEHLSEEPIKPIILQLNATFLEMGFAQTAAYCFDYYQLKQDKAGIKNAKNTSKIDVREQPFSAAEIATNQARLSDTVAPTDQELRAILGWQPALHGFFGLIEDTEPLKQILMAVMPTPNFGTLMSSLINGGLYMHFNIKREFVTAMKPESWGLPANRRLFRFPISMSLMAQEAIRLDLIVTDPEGPLRSVAGAVGALGVSVDNPDRQIWLRVLNP